MDFILVRSSLPRFPAMGAIPADLSADSSCFVEFMLEIIKDGLRELSVTENTADQVTDQVTDQVRGQAGDPVRSLLSALGNETLSATELMNRLGLSHRPTFRMNYLDPALGAHLIERTVPGELLHLSIA